MVDIYDEDLKIQLRDQVTPFAIAAGAVVRSLDKKLQDFVDVKDFGAIGNGVIDDTASIQNALDYAMENHTQLYISSGTYKVTNLLYQPTSLSQNIDIIGAGIKVTKLLGSGTGAILQINKAPVSTTGGNTSYVGDIVIRGVKFEGYQNVAGTNYNSHGILSYDLARSTIEQCAFDYCKVGIEFLGSTISNTIRSCASEYTDIGFKFDSDYSDVVGSGGAGQEGDPNHNTIMDSVVNQCTEWGIYFDGGRVLVVQNTEFEYTGAWPATESVSYNSTTFGGIYIGASAGQRRDEIKDNQSALFMSNCWFEGQKGITDIQLKNGTSVIRDCYFHTSEGWVKHNVLIEGGNYHLSNLYFLEDHDGTLVDPNDAGKTLAGESLPFGNIYESFASYGNSISNCNAALENITVDELKTSLSCVGAGAVVRSTIREQFFIGYGDQINTEDFGVKGQVLYYNGSGSGITPPTDADDVVLDSSGGARFTMLAPAAKSSRITFGNPSSPYDGWIDYNEDGQLQIRANGSTRLTIAANGEISMNLPTSAGATGSLWNDNGTVKVA